MVAIVDRLVTNDPEFRAYVRTGKGYAESDLDDITGHAFSPDGRDSNCEAYLELGNTKEKKEWLRCNADCVVPADRASDDDKTV